MVQTAVSPGLAESPGPLPQELAAIMWPELPALAEDMVEEIGQAVPEYRPLLDGPYRTVLLHSVQQNLTTFVEQVADPAASTAQRDEMCRRLGRFEAHEGRGLHCLQSAMRTSARVGLRRANSVGTRYNLPASLIVAFADAVFSYTDVIESLCREGYVEAKGARADEGESQRGRLLRLILAGPAVAHPSLTDLARRIGWAVPEEVTLVALAPTGERRPLRIRGLDADVLVDLEDRRPHLLVPGCVDEARAAMLERALEGQRAVVGVTVPLGGAADSLRWARQTQGLAESGVVQEADLIRCEEHLVTLWLLGDSALAERLATRQLAPLAGLTAGQRDRLVDTLRTWLTTRGTAAHMAELLHLHPQTVRYRMRALKKVLGAQLGDPEQRFATEMALRALHLRRRAAPAVRPGAGSPGSPGSSGPPGPGSPGASTGPALSPPPSGPAPEPPPGAPRVAHASGHEPDLPRGHDGG